jgi:hypothetical protein
MKTVTQELVQNIKINSTENSLVTGTLNFRGIHYFFKGETVEVDRKDMDLDYYLSLVPGTLNLYASKEMDKPHTSIALVENQLFLEDQVGSQLIQETYQY